MNSLNARLLRVEVVALRDDVFYGNLVVEHNGEVLNIDSRPSDALALAVRAHVPILVAREVMDAASITPEKDLQTPEEPVEPTSKTEILDEETDERLSVFEDFLQKLNIGDLDDSESGEEGDEENPDEEPPKKH